MITKSKSTTIFVLDLFIIYGSFLVVFVLYNGFVPVSLRAIMLMLFVGVAWFIVAFNSSAISINSDLRILSTLKDIVVAYSVLSVSVIMAVAIFGEFAPSNKLILWPLFIGLCFSATIRFFALVCAKHLLTKGHHQKHILLIGGGRVAEKVINEILSKRHLGYSLHGALAGGCPESLPERLYLGKHDKLSEIVRSGQVDEVIVALPVKLENEIVEIVEKCNQEGIRVRVIPHFFCIIRNMAVIDNLGHIPLIGIRPEPLSVLKNRVAKRTFDICFSLMALVILSPFLLAIALLIKLTSRGPLFFEQERIGANNKKFGIYKFRSMAVQPKKESDTVWTTTNDSRVTKIGKFIRRGNIDEFPQFWNVLIGNMSVVGPRPERGYFVEQFKKDIPDYKVRHMVKSGITGWAQVNGLRGDTSIKKRVECDIDYIENWSFQFDLKIIWLTLFGRETQKNGY